MTVHDTGFPGLAAIEAGAGEPVLLLHGWASSKQQWRPLIEALYDRYHVIAPDLVGYGDSPAWREDRRILLADHARLLADLLGRVRAPVHIVGHSFGGAVALRFAKTHPWRVRSLSLIEPVAFQALAEGTSTRGGLPAELRALAEYLRFAQAVGAPARGLERFVDFWNGPGAWRRLTPDLRADLTGRCGAVLADFVAVAEELPGAAQFAGLSVPAMILYGTRSPAPSVRIARLLAETMPGARAFAVEEAGHMLPVTHAATVNRRVAAHIDRHRAPARVLRLAPSRLSEPSGDRAGARKQALG